MKTPMGTINASPTKKGKLRLLFRELSDLDRATAGQILWEAVCAELGETTRFRPAGDAEGNVQAHLRDFFGEQKG